MTIGEWEDACPDEVACYVSEFQFRYNNDENDDIFVEAVRGC
jgi:hypothetical protein